jgi:hypothetical protein
MPSISIEDNIKDIEENIKKLIGQQNDIAKVVLRLEGALQVFNDMKKTGVTTIEVNDPINSEEVIDAAESGNPE